jgi:hypothetical protein
MVETAFMMSCSPTNETCLRMSVLVPWTKKPRLTLTILPAYLFILEGMQEKLDVVLTCYYLAADFELWLLFNTDIYYPSDKCFFRRAVHNDDLKKGKPYQFSYLNKAACPEHLRKTRATFSGQGTCEQSLLIYIFPVNPLRQLSILWFSVSDLLWHNFWDQSRAAPTSASASPTASSWWWPLLLWGRSCRA